MALSFSIENILARPTYRPIAPATVYTVVQPYPFVLTSSSNCPVSVSSGGVTLPTFSSTRKRRKRYRTIFSETQIELLEDLFRTTQYPDLYQRESVALKAGLQEERVEVWFKNRRARDRKLKKAKQSPRSCKTSDNDENETSETNTNKISEEKSESKTLLMCQTNLGPCDI